MYCSDALPKAKVSPRKQKILYETLLGLEHIFHTWPDWST